MLNGFEILIYSYLAIFLLIIIGALIGYILTSLGLYKMAKKLNIEMAWLSWIPLFYPYMLGKIAGDKLVIFNN